MILHLKWLIKNIPPFYPSACNAWSQSTFLIASRMIFVKYNWIMLFPHLKLFNWSPLPLWQNPTFLAWPARLCLTWLPVLPASSLTTLHLTHCFSRTELSIVQKTCFYSSLRLFMNTLHFITAVWSGGLIKNHTLQGSKSCTKQTPSLQLCITPSPPLTPFLTLTLNLWTWTSFLSPIFPHTMPYLQILTHPWYILWELGSVMGDVRRGVR